MDKSPVSSSLLEERVAMYLQAIEYATASNDNSRRQALERDIQVLMDLMEQISMGHTVSANSVPPPLRIHSHAGEPLANPLGELSSRLADYHKALYYADIEIGENRSQEIQTLQRGLQVIQRLQEKAQAGYPIRAEDIPPPVSIPSEDEFVVNPKPVILELIAQHYQAIEIAQDEVEKTKIQTLQMGIKKLDYLLKRAESNIPIYKKDLPGSPSLGPKFRKLTEQYKTTVGLLTKMSELSARAAKLAGARGNTQRENQLYHNAKMLTEVLHAYEMGKPLDMSSCPYSLADIEQLADEAGVPASQHIEDKETVRLRYNQYKLAALKSKRTGSNSVALQHMRIVKGLKPLLLAVERGETVDMTQVPPPPSEQTPTTEEAARVLSQKPQERNLQEEHPQPDTAMEGISLAEELSAFLCESPPSDDSGSQSESSSSGKSDSVNMLGDSLLGSPSDVLQNHDDSKTRAPKTSSDMNPLYTLSQNCPGVSRQQILDRTHSNSTQTQQQPIGPGELPRRSLKPVTDFSNLGQRSEQSIPISVNGFHGNGVVLDPRQQTYQFPKPDRKRKDTAELMDLNNTVNGRGSEESEFSSEMTCIEILKYERLQLEKEGNEDAQIAAKKLSHQMEGEKQRLRAGGYEAWLAYLGQVEDDVTHINCDMKLAREGGEESKLASLIIKKELAERELAVMRKRLPELQT